MRFDDDEQYGEEMVLSKEEIKLIKSKAKELKKICYGFGFFRFEVLSWHIRHEKKEDELVEFTYDQVAVQALHLQLQFLKARHSR